MKKLILFTLFQIFIFGIVSAQIVYINEDFETGMLPAGWSANPTSGAWTVPGITSPGFTPPAHTIYASVDDDASQSLANPNSVLITPLLNLSSATHPYLKFESYFSHLTYDSITETAWVNYSIDGGITWSLLDSIPYNASQNLWKTNVYDVTTQVAGQSSVKFEFVYSDNGGYEYGCAIDNVVLINPVANDVSLTSISPNTASYANYGTVGNNISLSGSFENDGFNPITSINIKYSDGTTIYTDNISSISVLPFTSYSFVHNVPFTIPQLGPNGIKMWLELTGDANHLNDSLTTIINGALFMPTHMVTVEELTATWCPYSPRSEWYLDSLHQAYPYSCNIINAHTDTPMGCSDYNTFNSPGFPSTMVNRSLVSLPDYSFIDYANTINDFGFASLTPTVTFDSVTRNVSIDVQTQFAYDLIGDYRLAVVATEDSVHGTTSAYNQSNIYSGQPLYWGGYENLPNPIPAAQMYYMEVARKIMGGYNGQPGSLPAINYAGSSQNYSFNWTIPANYNVNKMRITILLIDANDSQLVNYHILNSTATNIHGSTVGIATNVSESQTNLFPNPASANFTLQYSISKTENSTIRITDVLGNEIVNQNLGIQSAGNYQLEINAASWANGIYFVNYISAEGIVTKKIEVAH